MFVKSLYLRNLYSDMTINIQGLYGKPTSHTIPQLPAMDNTAKLPVEGFSVPGSSSYYDPIHIRTTLVREVTQNMEAVFSEANTHLGKILNALGSDLVIEQQSPTNQQICELNLKELTGYISNILKITPLNDEERKVLEKCEEATLTFPQLTEMLPKAEKLNVSEDMIRFYIASIRDVNWLTKDPPKHYFEWVREYMESKNVFQRFSDAKEQVLLTVKQKEKTEIPVLNQGTISSETKELSPLPEKYISTLMPVQPTDEKNFIGKIEKEPYEGNGLYVTSIGQILDEKGRTLIEPIGKKEVVLENLQNYGRRIRGEIDIELPVSHNEDGVIVLPTCLGFKACAVSFRDASGDDIPLENLKAEQDTFGITYIKAKDIPKYARTIKYRLEATVLDPLETIPDSWTKKIQMKHPRQGDEVFIEAIKRESGLQEKIRLLEEMVKRWNPIYTQDFGVQQVSCKSKNFFETQIAAGLVHMCNGQSLNWGALLRNYVEVPTLIASGLFLEETAEGMQFRSDQGHAQTLYLDRIGLPHTFEATARCSNNHVLNEDGFHADLPEVLSTVRSGSQSDVNKRVLQLSPNWRAEGQGGQEGGSVDEYDGSKPYLFGELPPLPNDFESSPAYQSETQIHLRWMYLRGTHLQKAVEIFPKILEHGEPIAILDAISNISCGLDDHYVLQHEIERGIIHLPLIRLQRDAQKCEQLFLQWSQTNPEKAKQVLDLYCSSDTASMSPESHALVASCLIPEQINLLSKDKLRDLLEKLDQDATIADYSITVCRSDGSQTKMEKKGIPQDLVVRTVYNICKKIGIENLEEHAKNNLCNIEPGHHIELAASRDWLKLQKLYGNKHFEKMLTTLILNKAAYDDLRKFQATIKSFYESEEAVDYLDARGGNICLNRNFREKILNELKQTLSSGSRDYFRNIKNLIPALSSIGIELKDVISRKQALEIIKQNYSGTIVHTRNGNLDDSKPLSLLLCQEHAVFFCNYFNIPIEELPQAKTTEEELWTSEIRPHFATFLQDYTVRSLLFSVPYITSTLEAIKGKDERLGKLIQDTAYPNSSQNLWIAVCERIPEAKEMVEERLKLELERLLQMEPANLEEIIINAYCFKNLSKQTQQRVRVLVDILRKSGLETTTTSKEFEKEYAKLDPDEQRVFSTMVSACDINELPFVNKERLWLSETFSHINYNGSAYRHIEHQVEELTTSTQDRNMLAVGLQDITQTLLRRFIPNLEPEELRIASEKIANSVAHTEPLNLTNSTWVAEVIMGHCREYKNEHYPQIGIGLVNRFLDINSDSHFFRQLQNKILMKATKDEVYALSEASEDFEKVQQAVKHLGNVTRHSKQLFNGYIPYVIKISESGLIAGSNSGEWHSLQEAQYPVSERDLVQGASARTGKLIVAKKKEFTEVTPYHYVVDLETLNNGQEINGLSGNLYKLMSELYVNLAKETKQNLHLFYRGEVISIHHQELIEMLSYEEIDDTYGRRTNVVDFIMQLKFLAKTAGEIRHQESYSDYKCATVQVPNNGWVPPGGGTAIVLTDNHETIRESIPIFQAWSKQHLAVKVPDLITSSPHYPTP